MKNIFYSFFLIFFLCFSLFANELDEEFIDKKYNEIETSDFCSIKEWNLEEKKLFVLAFILGWNWEVKEEEKLNKFNDKEFGKFFSQNFQLHKSHILLCLFNQISPSRLHLMETKVEDFQT